uniref:AAA_12 domain-containing protein n=1 Tax=Haemonchus placei TaxID=6290 RepID=A0A0N4W8P0_HAEPC
LSHSADFKPLPNRDEPWRIIESGELDDAVVFVDTCAKTNGIRAEDIGVMCVYRKQVDVIRSVLGDDIKIEVNSVDQFQGRDKRVIVWSLVWTEDSGRVSFSAVGYQIEVF